jgi:hypothetical protein
MSSWIGRHEKFKLAETARGIEVDDRHLGGVIVHCHCILFHSQEVRSGCEISAARFPGGTLKVFRRACKNVEHGSCPVLALLVFTYMLPTATGIATKQ